MNSVQDINYTGSKENTSKSAISDIFSYRKIVKLIFLKNLYFYESNGVNKIFFVIRTSGHVFQNQYPFGLETDEFLIKLIIFGNLI